MSASSKSGNNKFNVIFSVALFLMLGALTFLLFPKQSQFAYEFKKGSPWLHDDLIAPFDFAIHKTPDEVKTERDSIKTIFIPYYQIDSTVVLTVTESYIKVFNLLLSDSGLQSSGGKNTSVISQSLKGRLPENFKEKTSLLIIKSIEEIYSHGVIQLHDSVIKSETGKINLLNGNVSLGVKNTNSFISPDQAVILLKNTLVDRFKTPDTSGDSIIPYIIDEICSENLFKPNIVADLKTTTELLNQHYNSLAGAKGMVQQGELIILKGNIVDDNTYRVLISMKHEYEINTDGINTNWLQAGIALLIFIILLIYYLHLFFNFRGILFHPKHITFIIFQMAIMFVLTYLVINVWGINIYLIPFVIVPLLIYTFFNNRIALVSFWMLMLMIGFFAPNSFEFVFIQIVAGMVVLFSLRHIQRRFHLFVSVLLVLISYSLSYLGFTIIKEGGIAAIRLIDFAWFGGNAFLLLTLFPLMYLYEKLFGFISDVTLLELSDTNNPALRALAEKAPGTFQHSMQVANLAEDVVHKIGGSALLVRTGALYHDLGKTDISQYFIENQHGKNIHDDLTFNESANIIINHVSKGIELARKYRLPAPIMDFIKTHHGTTVTRYFYNSYVNLHPDEKVNLKAFSYPGPKPQNIETAVVMMADAIEASSRTLKTYTYESILSLVNKIVDNQVAEGQFENVNITFRNITEAKEIFVEKLMNIYHTRIEYPEINKPN